METARFFFRDGENSWVLESFVLQGFGGTGGNGIPVLVFLITSPVGLDPIPEMFVFKSKMHFAGTLRQKDWQLEIHLVVHLELHFVGSFSPCGDHDGTFAPFEIEREPIHSELAESDFKHDSGLGNYGVVVPTKSHQDKIIGK